LLFRRRPLCHVCSARRIDLCVHRLHGCMCISSERSARCYTAGAICGGFAQQPPTNGVFSLDSCSEGSVKWQQLARRTSPPKGFGRARGSLRVTSHHSRSALNLALGRIHNRRARIKAYKGSSQPELNRLCETDLRLIIFTEPALFHTADRRFCGRRIGWPLRTGGERENRACTAYGRKEYTLAET
jgi:hypothetical protein